MPNLKVLGLDLNFKTIIKWKSKRIYKRGTAMAYGKSFVKIPK